MSDLKDLSDWIGPQRGNLLTDLTDYVSQETPSNEKKYLTAGLNWLESWLHARLGTAAERQHIDGGEHGDTLVLDYPAETPTTSVWVTALCHYDTVWSAGTLSDWPPIVSDDELTGPGVFDMKAGLVQLVWAIRAVDTLSLRRPNLRIILNGDEEIGSPASRPVIEEKADRSTAVLVLEPSAQGALKTARKGVGIFKLDVEGIEAHAGLNPNEGVSAIDELARSVLQLHAASEPQNGTTVNVGIIHGGSRTNVKAGHATAEVDVRVSSDSEAKRIDELFTNLKPDDADAKITVTGGWNRPIMERTAPMAALFQMASSIADEMGFDLEEAAVGGGSDGNFAAARGLPVLDGLGAVGSGAHARNEWVSISGMVQRSTLTAALLTKLADASHLTKFNNGGRLLDDN